MKDAKKMVVLSWEKWAALRDAGDNVVPVVKLDAGVQTDVSGGTSGFLQDDHKSDDLDEGAGAGGGGGGSVSSVSLPTPPAEFVKAYFENRGETVRKASSKTDKKKLKPYLAQCREVSVPYSGQWVHLK